MSAPRDIARRGIMLVVSSPSGAGKTTLTRNLLEQEHGRVALSISVTTRAKRPSEINKVHYRFISPLEFEALKNNGELLEWAEVHGNFYGTPREAVEAALSQGHDVLFDIDWQGTRQLYESMRNDVVSVFVLPPSANELKSRLERRAEDDAKTIERRLRNAADEIQHWDEYDYVLVNNDLGKTFSDLQSILSAERRRRQNDLVADQQVDRLKRAQQPELREFVVKLVADLRRMTHQSPAA